MYKITGNTYPARTMLKNAGFTWHKEQSAWFGNEEAMNELKRISTPTYSGANAKAFRGLVIETV